MKASIAEQPQTFPDNLNLQQLHDKLNHVLQNALVTFFPRQRQNQDERISAHPQFQKPVRKMWDLYRTFKASNTASVQGCFQAWKQYTTFRKTSTQVKQAAKEVKRLKLQAAENQLQIAAGRGDQREVYQQVKKLAPWRPRKHVRIRGEDGAMLDPERQLQAIVDHCQKKFCQSADQAPLRILSHDFQVEVQEVSKALRSLPWYKAVPQHVPASAVWRLCSNEIAPHLTQAFRNTWQAGTLGPVPPDWRDAWLVWLVKPNKPSYRPDGLRPIGLTHPLSEVARTILRQHVKPVLLEALCTRPQIAYTAGRGTLDALLRVHGFLKQARTLSLAQKQSVHARYQGVKPSRCSGGICFSLDLESAFDAAPRPALANSLRRLGIAEDVVQLITQFHFGSCYRSTVSESTRAVGTTCGIKQGCKLAPYLFIALTIHVMDELAQSISWEWLQWLFTFYADDALASWLVREPEHLQQALDNIQTVIEVFNRLGMKINVKKSAVLYDLKGLDVKKILKKKLVKAHGSFFLTAQQQGEQVLIPIVRQHDYLGTIISFRDPANLTLNKRFLKARGQYSMLRKIVNSPRIVSKRCRYRIWEAGVLSSSTYGLLATGLTTTGCTRLRQMASRQMRAIAKLPAHLTHVPNAQVRAILGAPDMVQQLHDAGGRHLTNLEKISEATPQDI